MLKATGVGKMRIPFAVFRPGSGSIARTVDMPCLRENQDKINTGKEAAAYSPTKHLRGTVSSLFTIIMTFCLMLLKISNQYRKIHCGTQNNKKYTPKKQFFQVLTDENFEKNAKTAYAVCQNSPLREKRRKPVASIRQLSSISVKPFKSAIVRLTLRMRS